MKKLTSLTTAVILFLVSARSQETGYKTIDAGGEFQRYPHGSVFNLHVAFNAKIHNSFVLMAGYNKAGLQSTSLHNGEEGSGWGCSLGYRYYLLVVPHRFFAGVRADLWRMKIHWSIPVTESDSKLTILQPALETGYTLLINDMFFITPYIAAGSLIKLKNEGEKVAYGKGFIPLAGISAGWRF